MRKSFYLCFSLQTWNAGVWLGLFFVIAGSAVSAFAQTSDATAHAIANIRERDGLRVKNYEALDVYISLNDETTKLGITGDTVRTRVESRLRQANIQPVDPVSRDHQAIVVNIDVVGQAFHV